jgi:hypothetical protein
MKLKTTVAQSQRRSRYIKGVSPASSPPRRARQLGVF